MCTHNQYLRSKKEIYNNFLSENQHVYSREILLYIAWACLHNVYFKPAQENIEIKSCCQGNEAVLFNKYDFREQVR